MTSRRWILGLAGVAAVALLPALLFTFRSSEQASAVFSPPTDRNYVAIDCDTVAAGIQSSCNVVSGQPLDVGVVVGNVVGRGTPGAVELGSFQFTALADQTKLNPKNGVDTNLNANPDFNDPTITGGWNCSPPAPNRDQDPSATVAASFLGCVAAALDGPSIPLGGTATVAKVHYDTLAAGSTQLNLSFAVMGDDQFLTFADCNPNNDTNASCIPAIVTIEEPDIDFFSNVLLDCDADPGVQSTCFLPTGTTSATVDVVFENLSGGPIPLGAANANILGSNQALFTPSAPACVAPGTACNPDLVLADSGWTCGPPNPSPDQDGSPTTTNSFFSCFNGAGTGETVADGASIVIARLTLGVAGTGTGTFTLSTVNVADSLGVEYHSCAPGANKCVNASITIGSPPTPTAQAATATPTNTVAAATATNTNTATATNTVSANTATPTATSTATATNTVPANTATPTATNTATATSTATATNTVPANTATPTSTATATVPADTATPTNTATATVPADTATHTSTPTETSTSVPTVTNTVPADTATSTPTETPTEPAPAAAWTIRFDCDVVNSGIQDDCTMAGGATTAAIDVVLSNVSEDPGRRLGAFNFIVIGDNRPVFTPLVPGACAAPGLDCNPDFNQGMGGAGWSCAPPNPIPDSDPDVDPATSHSVISCFNGASDGPVLGPGQSVPLGRVTYTINGTGEGVFTSGTTNVYDDFGVDLLTCATEATCFPATIRTAAGQATATNTAVNTATATNTVPADTATATNTVPANTATPTNTVPANTATPTNTVPANTATPTNTVPAATATNTAEPTSTSTAVATATNTVEPTATNTPDATGTVEVTETVEVTRTVAVTRTVTITKTAGVTETPDVETETPEPSETPGVTQTPATSTATATSTVATSTSTAQPSVTATKPASTSTPTSTATRVSRTATTTASTATRESTVAAIATRPAGGSGGASALPDAGQGGSGGANDLTVAILSIAAAGVGLYGVVAMKRRRAR